MNEIQRSESIARLQNDLRTSPKLKLEFMAAISRLWREHNLDVSAEELSLATITLNPLPDSGDSDDPPPVPSSGI